jgi:uncharacterized membrane protein HdeD (DUF308 family)
MSVATRIKIETVAARGTMVAVAVMTFAIGFAVLSSPMAVAFTVGLWLGGAALTFLGLFGELPNRLG